MRCVSLLFAVLVYNNGIISAQVTGKQYASVPELFYQDNYDICMLLDDEAFYCALTYELEPLSKENPPEIWVIVKNLSDVETNYRHDHLRHWICVPKTCPGINIRDENDPLLKEALKNCYDKKYKKMGLKGIITKIECETTASKYPVDWLDVFAIFFFSCYIIFIIYATYYEGTARYECPEEYEKLMNTPMGRLYSACSLTRNWIRLKTVKSTTEIDKLRCIQGIKVYNTGLVILSHSILGFLAVPVANTLFTETMHENHARLLFSSGPLCVATFFFISAFLLSNGLFDYMKEKSMSLKTIFFIFANRIFRLTPTLFAVVLFHATILRHTGSGPSWNHLMVTEYKKCRKNGWANLFYINNWIDPYNMCVPVTWYLALDTQYFLFLLFFIWLLKAHEKHIWLVITTSLSLVIVGTFIQNYYYDFTALVLPTVEMYYGLDKVFNSQQFHFQLCSAIGNVAGQIMGVAFGYYFCKHKNDETPFFNTKFRKCLWWILSFGLALGFIIIPGSIILRSTTEHNRIWASIYVAVSRTVFTFALGILIIGFTEGVGWLALRTVRWPPTYIIGRLSLSAYLIHMSIVLIRPSLSRHSLYISNFQIFLGFAGDLSIVYVASALLTLFIELPVSELQKIVFRQKSVKEEGQDTESKDK